MKSAPSIRTVLSMVLILFALIPTLIAGILEALAIRQSYEQSGRTTVNQTADAIASEIRQIVGTVENTASILALNQLLYTISSRLASGDVPLADELDAYRSIRDELTLISIDRPFYNIRVFLPDSKLVTHERTSIFGLSMLPEFVLPDAITDGSSNCGWTEPYSVHNHLRGEDVRILSYYYRAAYFRSSMASVMIAVDIAEAEILRCITRNAGFEGSFSLNGLDGGVLIRSGDAPQAGDYSVSLPTGIWRLNVSAPMGQFMTGMRLILRQVLITLMLFMCLIPVLSLYVARLLLKGVDELNASNRDVLNNRYHTVPENASTKELRELQQSYNVMITKMTDLIHNVYEEQLARQEAEIVSLFEQIKPHFLYNTLESGKWMALQENAERTAEFLENLALMFRLSLNKGEPFVPLEQELKHVELYVRLINKCSDNQVRLLKDIGEDASSQIILKLTLQPLVENAIEHGIREMADGGGDVRIAARREGNRLIVTVEDHGAGVDEQTLTALNADSCGGYGIHNIRKRMRLYYGDRCKLEYRALQPHGLCAAIEIRDEA